jgi:hypothetical protein
MMEVGNLAGPNAFNESRTHFGLWCINSSPLVIGMDITNDASGKNAKLDRCQYPPGLRYSFCARVLVTVLLALFAVCVAMCFFLSCDDPYDLR